MQPSGVVSLYNKLGHWDLEKMVARDKRLDGSSSMFVVGGILKCKSNAIDERAYAFQNLFIPTGGWVEVEFMAKSISGAGKMSIDLYDNGTFTEDPTTDSIDITERNWKYYRFALPVSQSLNFVRIVFGQWKSSVGETWYKDISIKAYNTNPQPDVRFCAFSGKGLSWNIEDGIGEYANEGVISATGTNTYVLVEFVPFNTWYKPIFLVGASREGNLAKNIMAVTYPHDVDPERKVRVYFIDSATGDRMDMVNITDTMTVFFEAKSK